MKPVSGFPLKSQPVSGSRPHLRTRVLTHLLRNFGIHLALGGKTPLWPMDLEWRPSLSRPWMAEALTLPQLRELKPLSPSIRTGTSVPPRFFAGTRDPLTGGEESLSRAKLHLAGLAGGFGGTWRVTNRAYSFPPKDISHLCQRSCSHDKPNERNDRGTTQGQEAYS